MRKLSCPAHDELSPFSQVAQHLADVEREGFERRDRTWEHNPWFSRRVRRNAGPVQVPNSPANYLTVGYAGFPNGRWRSLAGESEYDGKPSGYVIAQGNLTALDAANQRA